MVKKKRKELIYILNTDEKEVRFDLYCSECKFYETSEADPPCCECLEVPSKLNSVIPIKFSIKE